MWKLANINAANEKIDMLNLNMFIALSEPVRITTNIYMNYRKFLLLELTRSNLFDGTIWSENIYAGDYRLKLRKRFHQMKMFFSGPLSKAKKIPLVSLFCFKF